MTMSQPVAMERIEREDPVASQTHADPSPGCAQHANSPAKEAPFVLSGEMLLHWVVVKTLYWCAFDEYTAMVVLGCRPL